MTADRTIVKILTYNTRMLPGPFGNGRKDEARARQICAELMHGELSDVDIVCFQEVFDEDSREIFERELKPRLPFALPKSFSRPLLFEDSGLFVASRFPILSPGHKPTNFHRYRTTGPPRTADYWADKGVCAVHLDISTLGPNRKLVVLNTHLQSDYHGIGQYRFVRQAQLLELRAFVSNELSRVGADDRCSVVLAGDFNIVAEIGSTMTATDEYSMMLSLLDEPREVYRETNPDCAGCTVDWSENPDCVNREKDFVKKRLDYLLTWDQILGTDDPLLPLRFVDAEIAHFRVGLGAELRHLSDHFGVTAVIE